MIYSIWFSKTVIDQSKYLLDLNGKISTIRTCGRKHNGTGSERFREKENPNKAYAYCSTNKCNSASLSNISYYRFKEEENEEEVVSVEENTEESTSQNQSKTVNDSAIIRVIYIILLILSLTCF